MKKKVQVGRSRLQEEMANPTWSGRRSSVKTDSKATDGGTRVQKVEAAPVEKKKLRVASYCRVSTDMEEQESSIDGQRAHYRVLFKPGWR